MIQEHEFNTRWWGSPVGVVTGPEFFATARADRLKLMEPYQWVELSLPLNQSLRYSRDIFETGFRQVDTQVSFRINLRKLAGSKGAAGLEARFADEQPFAVTATAIADFTSERFLQIPGATQDKVNERFALWSSDLISASPAHCIQLSNDEQVQGWFLSQQGDSGAINLALAMLSSDASISGLYVYRKALQAYAQRGHKLGWASFSASNTPVHNIYSSLGAHFTAPRGNWFWFSPG